MKLSRTGNVSVVLLVGLGFLVVTGGFLYVYFKNLQRYANGPLAVAARIAQGGRHRHTLSHRVMPVPKLAYPSLEPTFQIIGPAGGRKIIQKVMPSYPLWAEEEGISTEVQLAFRVDDTGGVAPNVWVTKMGYPDFDAAAVQALKQWKFEPLDHVEPLPPEPNVVKDVDRGQPAVIDFTFRMAKPPVRI